MVNMILQVHEELELLAKALEVILHPAWQGNIDQETVITLLQDKPTMTYILHQDSKSKYDYWLSHKKNNGELHHRHFAIRLFPDGWFFANTRALPHECLDDFVKGALVCKD